MSQTNYTPISLYYSATASASPSSANLINGELAINITDGKLFYKDNAGAVQTLATKATTAGTFGAISVTSETNSGTLTLSGGTANGVAYLNGSKILTTGSALTFDGTKLVASGGNEAIRVASAAPYYSFYNAAQTTQYGYIQHTGTDLAIVNVQNGAIPFYVNNAEQMRLTSTGLGIGTSSPGYKLDVRGVTASGNGTITTGFSWDTRGLIGTFSNHSLGFMTNGTVIGMFDTAGNLGLGVTPSAWFSTYKAIQLSFNASLTANSDFFAFGNNYYTDTGGTEKYLGGGYATKFRSIAGTGQFQWYTAPLGTAGNAITFTQAMTLDASGNLLVGTTNITGPITSGGTGVVLRAAGQIYANDTYLNVNADGTIMQFRRSGTAVGSITVTTTGTLYNVTSDQRLKENIDDAPEFGSVIDSLQVRSYDWKADQTHQRAGFIAQELVTVAPEAVHQPENPEEMMAVDYSKLVPMLVKEIQSLRKRLTALETK